MVLLSDLHTTSEHEASNLYMLVDVYSIVRLISNGCVDLDMKITISVLYAWWLANSHTSQYI
jgi:hypothetical protein